MVRRRRIRRIGHVVRLPLVQTAIQELSLLQTKWKAILDVLLNNQLTQGALISGVVLSNGTTTTIVNHLLGRPLVGWFLVGSNGTITQIFDNQSNNPHPELTLSLTSTVTGTVTINLWVF